jgi:hypothetical protein
MTVLPVFGTTHATVALLLQVTGTVLFILAGLGIPEPARFRFLGWGLAMWSLSAILPF